MERPAAQAPRCASCNTPLKGRFCHKCGERRLFPGDLHLRHYAGQVVNALTFAESKLWRSLLLLITKPGELTLAWSEGRRVNHMRPIALFFLANVLYFLAPFINTFVADFENHTHLQWYSEWARETAEEKRLEQNRTPAEFAAEFNRRNTANAKLLIILLAAVTALPLALLHPIRSKPFATHLTMGFELYSFTLLVNMLAVGGLLILIARIAQVLGHDITPYMGESLITPLFLLLTGQFLYRAERRLYQSSWWAALLRTVAIFAASWVLVVIYRWLQFTITLAFM